MANKARSKEDKLAIKSIVRNMWVFEGYSTRKIASEFNANYADKYGTISFTSVALYVKEIRRELENWLDEDALEKYTGEFVRQQHIMDQQIENLRKVQRLIDTNDPKERELYLRYEDTIHKFTVDKTRMMSEIELVLRVKKLNKENRLKNETLQLVDENNNKVAEDRGYKIPTALEELEKEGENDQEQS